MAQRWAVANGFADVAATWNGGTLPDPTDDLYSNNFAVSIRADLTANSIKKIAGTTAVLGGSWTVTAAATVTLTAGIVTTDNGTNSTSLLTIDAGAGAVTLTTPASIVGGQVGAARYAVTIAAGQTGTVTINAAQFSAGSTTACYAVHTLAATGSVVLNGNVGGAGFTGAGGVVSIGGTAPVTINGNVTGVGSNTVGVVIQSPVNATLTVNGTVAGGAGSGYGIGFVNGVSGSLLLVATNVTGGASATGHGIYAASGNALNATAIFTGGSVTSSVAVLCEGATTLRGTFRASATTQAVTALGPTRISGTVEHSATSRAPISGSWTLIAGEETTYQMRDDSAFPAGNGGTLVSLSLQGTNNPDEADVREGVTYGASGTLEGTLAVPAPDAVALGAPTDDTVGSAVLRVEQLAAVMGAQLAAVANFVAGPVSAAPLAEIRYETDLPFSYTGRAPGFAAEADETWEVTRITLTAVPPLVEIGAGSWDDRATLTYA